MKKSLSILGMLGVLVGSFCLDLFFGNTPGAIPFWTELPFYGVLVFLLLALAWIVLVASPRSLWVAVIYIAVGLCGLLFITAYASFPSQWSFDRLSYIYPWVNPYLLHLPLTQHAAGMILVIGMLRLLPKNC